MKTILTGRAVIVKKDTVDDARSLDILSFQRQGLFKEIPTGMGTITWRRGNQATASISFQLVGDFKKPYALRLLYSLTVQDSQKKESLDYQILLATTQCNLGGIRWWFICPIVKHGEPCKRRCRILYLPYGSRYFGCRECHELTYTSRQNHRSKPYENFIKPMKTIQAMREKLPKRISTKKAGEILQRYVLAKAKIYSFFVDWDERSKSR